MLQAVQQFQAAAGHPGVVLAAHLQRGGGANGVAGLGDALLTGEHFAGQNQRLSAGPAFHQAARHEGLVGPHFAAGRLVEGVAGHALAPQQPVCNGYRTACVLKAALLRGISALWGGLLFCARCGAISAAAGSCGVSRAVCAALLRHPAGWPLAQGVGRPVATGFERDSAERACRDPYRK